MYLSVLTHLEENISQAGVTAPSSSVLRAESPTAPDATLLLPWREVNLVHGGMRMDENPQLSTGDTTQLDGVQLKDEVQSSVDAERREWLEELAKITR